MQDIAKQRKIVPIGMFTANGLVIGAWAAAIPGLAERLNLSDSRLAAVLLTFAIGGIAMMIATPSLIRRVGAVRLAIVSGVAFAAAPVLPLTAARWELAIAGAAVFGVAHGAMDIAMNAAAIDFERRRGKPILSRLHGCFSVGAMLGALIGGWLASIALPVWMYAATVTVIACAFLAPSVFATVAGTQQHENASATHPPAASQSSAVLMSLAFVAFACLVAEGGMIDWLAKLMRGFGAGEFAAASVYAAFAGGMAAGRLAGDKIGAMVGDRRVVIGGAGLAGICLAITLVCRRVEASVPLMLLAGLGVANIVPAVFRASATVGRVPAASLAFVTACGYAGFLAGPPAIGWAADVAGLRIALAIVVVGLGAAAVASPIGFQPCASVAGDQTT